MTVDPTALATGMAREARLTGPGRADSLERTLDGVELRIVGIGWAVVELERAAVELEPASGTEPGAPVRTFEPGAADDLLGAASLVGRPVTGEPTVVLLEPITEGRLAAALARRGEGPMALFLAPVDGSLQASLDRLASVGTPTRVGHGPFGEAALVLGRPVAGPQLILVAVPSGS